MTCSSWARRQSPIWTSNGPRHRRNCRKRSTASGSASSAANAEVEVTHLLSREPAASVRHPLAAGSRLGISHRQSKEPIVEPEQGKSRPHEEYAHRLRDRQERRARLAKQERWLGNGRVVVFLIGLTTAILAFKPEPLLSPWWLVLPVAVFSGLLVWHERVTRDWIRAGRAVAFYERGLARLEDRWKGSGQQGERFLDRPTPDPQGASAPGKYAPPHPNAADLDLFGHGSLFELLCTARTRTGEIGRASCRE